MSIRCPLYPRRRTSRPARPNDNRCPAFAGPPTAAPAPGHCGGRDWQRRTNIWRKVTSPAPGAKPLRSGMKRSAHPCGGRHAGNPRQCLGEKGSEVMKKLVLVLIAIGCLALWAMHPAAAQSCCRGGAYTGAGSNPTPGVPRHASTQAHQQANGNYAYARRAYARRTGGGNPRVPQFCYSLRTGKFTHWGPCRVVMLPGGIPYKVAH